jgi:cytochrome c553
MEALLAGGSLPVPVSWTAPAGPEWAPGAPDLRGQQRAYLEQELQAFATDNRRNDIREQMRTIARKLTSAEIALIAAYYSSVGQQ